MTAQISYRKAIYSGFSDLSVFGKQLIAIEGLHRYVFGATQIGDDVLKTLKSFKDVSDFYSFIPEADKTYNKVSEFVKSEKSGSAVDVVLQSVKFLVCTLKVTEIVKKTFKLAIFNQFAFGMCLAKGLGEVSVQSYNIYKSYGKIKELNDSSSSVDESKKEKWSEIAMSVSVIGLTITDVTVKTVIKFTGFETVFVLGGAAISTAGFCKSYYKSLADQKQKEI